MVDNKEELTWTGLEGQKNEKSTRRRQWQIEAHLEEEWESVKSWRSRDVLKAKNVCPSSVDSHRRNQSN